MDLPFTLIRTALSRLSHWRLRLGNNLFPVTSIKSPGAFVEGRALEDAYAGGNVSFLQGTIPTGRVTPSAGSRFRGSSASAKYATLTRKGVVLGLCEKYLETTLSMHVSRSAGHCAEL